MDNKPKNLELVWSLFTQVVEVSGICWHPAVVGLLQDLGPLQMFQASPTFCVSPGSQLPTPPQTLCSAQNPPHCPLIAENAVLVRLEAAAAAAEGAGRPMDAGKLMLRRCSCFTESSSGAGQELARKHCTLPPW